MFVIASRLTKRAHFGKVPQVLLHRQLVKENGMLRTEAELLSDGLGTFSNADTVHHDRTRSRRNKSWEGEKKERLKDLFAKEKTKYGD